MFSSRGCTIPQTCTLTLPDGIIHTCDHLTGPVLDSSHLPCGEERQTASLPPQVAQSPHSRCFHTCTIYSITNWMGNATRKEFLVTQRVMHSAKRPIRTTLPNLRNIYTKRYRLRTKKIFSNLACTLTTLYVVLHATVYVTDFIFIVVVHKAVFTAAEILQRLLMASTKLETDDDCMGSPCLPDGDSLARNI